MRFQGGHNAGHTLVVDGKVYKLSLLPSGIVRGALSIIGNGVVLDPWHLRDEIKKLEGQGVAINTDNFGIAENCPADPADSPRPRRDARRCQRQGQDWHDPARHWSGPMKTRSDAARSGCAISLISMISGRSSTGCARIMMPCVPGLTSRRWIANDC